MPWDEVMSDLVRFASALFQIWGSASIKILLQSGGVPPPGLRCRRTDG